MPYFLHDVSDHNYSVYAWNARADKYLHFCISCFTISEVAFFCVFVSSTLKRKKIWLYYHQKMNFWRRCVIQCFAIFAYYQRVLWSCLYDANHFYINFGQRGQLLVTWALRSDKHVNLSCHHTLNTQSDTVHMDLKVYFSVEFATIINDVVRQTYLLTSKKPDQSTTRPFQHASLSPSSITCPTLLFILHTSNSRI